jgi:hypothetical protein
MTHDQTIRRALAILEHGRRRHCVAHAMRDYLAAVATGNAVFVCMFSTARIA